MEQNSQMGQSSAFNYRTAPGYEPGTNHQRLEKSLANFDSYNGKYNNMVQGILHGGGGGGLSAKMLNRAMELDKLDATMEKAGIYGNEVQAKLHEGENNGSHPVSATIGGPNGTVYTQSGDDSSSTSSGTSSSSDDLLNRRQS